MGVGVYSSWYPSGRHVRHRHFLVGTVCMYVIVKLKLYWCLGVARLLATGLLVFGQRTRIDGVRRM